MADSGQGVNPFDKFMQNVVSRPPGGGVSPVYIPYEYLPGDRRCFRILCNKDRVAKVTKYGGMALAEFNAKNRTDYKLEECKEICYNVRDRYRIHCNFTAKPDSAPLKPGDFSTYLFFADLEQNLLHNVVPLSCHLLDEDAKVKLGCSMCVKRIYHPAAESDEDGIGMREAHVEYYRNLCAPLFSDKEKALLDTAAVLFAHQ